MRCTKSRDLRFGGRKRLTFLSNVVAYADRHSHRGSVACSFKSTVRRLASRSRWEALFRPCADRPPASGRRVLAKFRESLRVQRDTASVREARENPVGPAPVTTVSATSVFAIEAFRQKRPRLRAFRRPARPGDPYRPSRHQALPIAIRNASATRIPGSSGSWLMPATVYPSLRRSPIQSDPPAARPGRTERMSGSGLSESHLTAPPEPPPTGFTLSPPP